MVLGMRPPTSGRGRRGAPRGSTSAPRRGAALPQHPPQPSISALAPTRSTWCDPAVFWRCGTVVDHFVLTLSELVLWAQFFPILTCHIETTATPRSNRADEHDDRRWSAAINIQRPINQGRVTKFAKSTVRSRDKCSGEIQDFDSIDECGNEICTPRATAISRNIHPLMTEKTNFSWVSVFYSQHEQC